MQAILVRIAADHSYGEWNAPADPLTKQFVYVPIPEKPDMKFHPGCERRYQEFVPALERFARDKNLDLFSDLRCPRELLDRSMHLDPDFSTLTYGDMTRRRGSHIRHLDEGDLLVFYAGLRPCRPCDQKLIYALIGLYVVDEVVDAASVPQHRWNENAHTRRRRGDQSEIVVRAKPKLSGRLSRYIDIGEYRDRAYRVRRDVLEAWGGLSVNDGYIQRSARPPRFLDAQKFRCWFDQQDVELVAENNPGDEPDRIVIVHLRRPRRQDPQESRSDPFWEFGSFGCTGCHSRNLMNPKRISELEGVRLAFVQGGRQGFKLVKLTSPVRVVRHGARCEVRWEPAEMPFRYDTAPLVVDSEGNSDFDGMLRMIRDVDRSTWAARFSSAFRSRRTPLRLDVAAEMIQVYQRYRNVAPPSVLAKRYEQVLTYPPNSIDRNREQTYKKLIQKLDGQRRLRSC